MKRRGRILSDGEVEDVLSLDVPAHLATLDRSGFPRITPIWFLWEDGVFYMTSVEGTRPLRDLSRDPRACVCIDLEERKSIAGTRPNCIVKGRGLAQVIRDEGGYWTRRITFKYYAGRPEAEEVAERRGAMPRMVIALRPQRLIRIGTHERMASLVSQT